MKLLEFKDLQERYIEQHKKKKHEKLKLKLKYLFLNGNVQATSKTNLYLLN